MLILSRATEKNGLGTKVTISDSAVDLILIDVLDITYSAKNGFRAVISITNYSDWDYTDKVSVLVGDEIQLGLDCSVVFINGNIEKIKLGFKAPKLLNINRDDLLKKGDGKC